jgi:hypothetical protein
MDTYVGDIGDLATGATDLVAEKLNFSLTVADKDGFIN